MAVRTLTAQRSRCLRLSYEHWFRCGAGCVLGDLIAEWIVFAAALQLLGLALPTEYLLDYVLALSWGILFQYFAIAPMRQLSLGNGLKLAAKADCLAISAFEVGLFG
jgi:hypothetical protein